MKKWEEQNKNKIHQKKVSAAKSTLNSKNPNRSIELRSPPSTLKSPLDSTPNRVNTSQSIRSSNSMISDLYDSERTDPTSVPLYKILKHNQLQQYAKALISRDFGYDLTKLARLNRTEVEYLINDIKMLPGHRVKFMKLVQQITQMLFEIMDQEDLKDLKTNFFVSNQNLSKPQSAGVSTRPISKIADKKPGTSMARKTNPSTTMTQTTYSNTKSKESISRSNTTQSQPPKIPNMKSKKKLEKIGIDFFQDSQQSLDDEFNKYLDNVIEKYRETGGQGNIENFDYNQLFTASRKNAQLSEFSQKIGYAEAEDMRSKLRDVPLFFSLNPKAIGSMDSLDSNSSRSQQTSTQKSKQNSRTDSGYKYESDSSTKALSNSKSKSGITGMPFAESSSDSKKSINSAKSRVDAFKPAEKKETKDNFKFSDLKPVSGKPITATTTKSNPLQQVIMKSGVLDYISKKIDMNNLDIKSLNTELKKIKDLYSSFDGAKMTSTIINLDIEEMCHCLACAIQKHLEYFVNNILPTEDFSFEKSNYSQPQSEQKSLQNAREVKMNFKMAANSQVRAQDDLYLEQMQNDYYEMNRENFKKKMLMEEAMEYESKRYQSNPDETSEDYGEEPIKVVQEDYPEEEDQVNMGSEFIEEDEKEQEDDPVIGMAGTMSKVGTGERGSLAVISERTYEGSQLTFKNAEVSHQDQKSSKEGDGSDQEQEGVLDDFLRESLRESVLNMNSLKDKGAYDSQIKQIYPNAYKGYQEQYSHDEVEEEESEEQPSEEKDSFIESYMSKYTDIDMNSDSPDQLQLIRNRFDRTYNEKDVSPEEFLAKLKNVTDKNVIANFCKNIVITSKMEKEVVIVCLIYIERLILRTGMYLSGLNWRRITFICLCLASKIWDDESFENNNFARAFPMYSTKEINELERVLLEFIDYDLVIKGNEYAKYYFILRAFADRNKKSFPLKALDLRTVLKLQNKATRTSHSLREVYSQSLNRTFA